MIISFFVIATLAAVSLRVANVAIKNEQSARMQSEYEIRQRFILTAQRDSVWHEQRVIVYALTGDLGEASLELELAIDQLKKAGGSEVTILEREEWLSSLRIGINPFDLTTLERLRLEEAGW